MKKILVVEDEVVIAMSLQRRLTSMGYDVVGICHNAETGIEMARKLDPDLILMDIMMPGNLDGISGAQAIKAEFDIPVIFLTAYTEDQLIEKAKQIEPHGYLVKPIQDRELKAAVEIAIYKQEMVHQLKASEQQYRSMIDAMGDAIHVVDRDMKILIANPTLLQWNERLGLDTNAVGKRLSDLYPFLSDDILKEYDTVFSKGKILVTEETTRIKKEVITTEVRKIPIFEQGEIVRIITIIRDITQRKKVEKELKKAHAELEKRVKKRTKDLEIKTKSLEELNTAMKVLLKKREDDKIEVEDNVLTNVTELNEPYFEKINKTDLDDHQKAFLSIIESNLREITSPFTRKMSLKHLNLTPTEIRIANLIRHGSPTKKIAEIMKSSPRTVDTHRKNIRRKVGLDQKRANLRSYLLSLH
ncbi:MAG: response regulator [Desulfobacterales bacterium]|nr:MAG: response regulator [Desulfobacterales bacterium]